MAKEIQDWEAEERRRKGRPKGKWIDIIRESIHGYIWEKRIFGINLIGNWNKEMIEENLSIEEPLEKKKIIMQITWFCAKYSLAR